MIARFPFPTDPTGFDLQTFPWDASDSALTTPPSPESPEATHTPGARLAFDSFSAAPDATPSSDPFALWGSRWGDDPTHLGGAGGVVTWSLVGDGTPIAPDIAADIGTSFGHPVAATTALSSFLYDGFVEQLKAAFAQWSSVANIDFVQVQDDGGAVGTGPTGDIRISGLPEDGAGATLAFAYYPNQGPISGDVFFDSGDAGFYDPHSFFLVATHEIGHAIGLEHSQTPAAVMYPFYNGALSGLTDDDIAGARAVYGPADPAALKVYALAGGETSLTILSGDANFVINANDAGDAITGSPENEVINGGTGADVIAGGGGNDTLTGGGGDDRFVFHGGDGNDTVTDFTAGHDVLELNGYGASTFDQLAPLLSDHDGATVIAFDPSNEITLQNVTVAQLHQSDFAFA
ncbi:MAG: matrixin family metalloprotease [Gemmatimonas sp.]